MKFLELHLLRFGSFTDTPLDFSGSANLHVIFGANEAGKSTTLRAIKGFLFGIPERTQDSHLHTMKDLRIAAKLENQHAKQIHLIRRKGRSKTLSCAVSQQSYDEHILTDFIGTTNETIFTSLFGLTHADLIRGGQELLDGKGELGESLFGAGLGMQGLHGVRSKLLTDAQTLFLPQGQKPLLNSAIRRFKEAKKTIIEQRLLPKEWQDKQTELQRAEQNLQALERDYNTLLAELNHLQRLQRTLPLLHHRQALSDQREALGPVALLRPNCTETRLQAQAELQRLQQQQQRLQNELVDCEQRKTALTIPQSLLAKAPLMDAFRDQLANYQRVLHDLPNVKASLANSRETLRSILRELGRDPNLSFSEIENLSIDNTAQTQLRQLAKQRAELNIEQRTLKQNSANYQQRRSTIQQQLAADGTSLTATNLRALQTMINELAKLGDIELQWVTSLNEAEELQQQATAQLNALGLWQGGLEELLSLSLPLAETIQRHADERQHLQQQHDRLSEQLAEAQQRQQTINHEIDQLNAQGAIPSADLLQQARAERDVLWQQIIEHFNAHKSAPIADLSAAFQHKTQQADTIADQLWQDAERATKHASLVYDSQYQQQRQRSITNDIAAANQALASFEQRWQQLWQPCAITPLSPEEMQHWLIRYQQLAKVIQNWQEKKSICARLQETIKQQQQRSQQLLRGLNQSLDDEHLSLHEIQPILEELLSTAQQQTQQRQQLTHELQGLEQDQQQLQKTLQDSEHALQQWQQQWSMALQPLALTAIASADEMESALITLGRLFTTLTEARGYQIRIEQMQASEQQFQTEVVTLCQDCAPDLQQLPTVNAATELHKRFQQGLSDKQQCEQLEQQSQTLKHELQSLQHEHDKTLALLQQLQTEAGVDSVAELQAAEQRFQQLQQINNELQSLAQQLSHESIPLTELQQQAESVNADNLLHLPAQIERLQAQKDSLGQQLGQQREQLGQLKTELGRIDGSDQAAATAAEAEQTLAEIHHHVEEYVCVKLSALLLDREIERYRERHQGPIMQRAGEFFRRMTLDRFSGLSSEFNHQDKLELRCLRTTGQSLSVENLSEGTRDQLYLALRLASLERHAQENEPLPLIIDDLLINFDDERTVATLILLAELSQHSQILFFTHHQHLLALAQHTIDSVLLKTHVLRH